MRYTPEVNTTTSATYPVILDTNIWLDWLLFDDACITTIQRLFQKGKIQLIATVRMRQELQLVLQRDKFAETLANQPNKSVDSMLKTFDELVQIHPTADDLNESTRAMNSGAAALVCKDPDDQMFFDLAWDIRPCTLVSKDKLVLALAKKAKKLAPPTITICKPQNFALIDL